MKIHELKIAFCHFKFIIITQQYLKQKFNILQFYYNIILPKKFNKLKS